MIDFLKRDASWDKFALTGLPEHSANVTTFISLLNREKIRYELDEPNGFVYARTKGDWEHFYETQFVPKNKDLAKSERRIERAGYQLEYTTYKMGIYDELLKRIDLYAQRRESLGQFNKYETDNLKQFLR